MRYQYTNTGKAEANMTKCRQRYGASRICILCFWECTMVLLYWGGVWEFFRKLNIKKKKTKHLCTLLSINSLILFLFFQRGKDWERPQGERKSSVGLLPSKVDSIPHNPETIILFLSTPTKNESVQKTPVFLEECYSIFNLIAKTYNNLVVYQQENE